jgi:hypothetical protein
LRGKALGKQHPDTLTSMNDLVSMLSSQGKHHDEGRRCIDRPRKALGKKHPGTLEP